MKKFNTIALFLVFSILVYSLVNVADAAEQITPKQHNCAFLPNAPDQHVVVKGDTLWGISGMFLEHPWCWPDVWGMNRAEIKNPHWIYPGQIVYFDRAAGRLRLGVSSKGKTQGNEEGMPTVRISPRVRSENIMGEAISAIPANDIEPFLSQPLVLNEADFHDAPRIVSAQEGHINVGRSEKAYVMGDLHGMTNFQVYRPTTPMINPQNGELLGYESVYVGTLKLIRAGKEPNEAHTFLATKAKEEMTVGDHLLPVPNVELTNYVPHVPEREVQGQIVSIYGGVRQAGQSQTVSINVGANAGMDVGTVLRLYRKGEVIADRTQKGTVKLPDEEYGTLFVFRVFKNVSYGLIMNVSDAAEIGDIVRSPE